MARLLATRCCGTRSSGIRCCGTRSCGTRCSGIRSCGTRCSGTRFFGTRRSLIRVSRLLTPSLHEPQARETRGTGDLGTVEGDLRPVTILFADIRGFTRLSEVLSPEHLVAAINGCFEVLDEAISRYGGEVDKFLGDAVMATFGAPVAHADDPRRAVLAALDMQSAMSRLNRQLRKQIGCELEMRIGINTGVVLAGPIGSRRKRAFTVMGDAVNVAARLEHSAPVGGIVVGEATRAYLGSSFRLRRRRSVRIRGKDTPVHSYVVLGQSAGTRRRATLDRHLGRQRELDQIASALGRLRAGRRVVVEIEGGMG